MPPLTKEQFDEFTKQGFTPEQIIEFEKRAQASGQLDGKRPTKKAPFLLEEGLRSLPTLGGLGGGMAGGIVGAGAGGIGAFPGGVVGAGLGGAGGATLEHILRQVLGYEQTPDLQGALGMAPGIGMEGVSQAAAQAAGEKIVNPLVEMGMQKLAVPLYAKALRIPKLDPGRSLNTNQFAEQLAKRALKERVPIGPAGGGKLGSQKMNKVLKTSGGELTKLLKHAEQRGVRLQPADIAGSVTDLMEEIVDQPISHDDLLAAQNMADQFLYEHPGPMTPLKVKMLKRRAQALAEVIIKGKKIRPGVDPKHALGARFNYHIAQGAKRALEEIPDRSAPGFAPLGGKTIGEEIARREAHTSEGIDLQKGLAGAERATSKVTLSPTGPVDFIGASTPKIRLTRPAASQIALGMTHPAVGGAAAQSPRFLALLHDLVYGPGGQEEDQ